MYTGKHAAGQHQKVQQHHQRAARPRKKGYIRVFILWTLLLTVVLSAASFVYAKFLEESIHDGAAGLLGSPKTAERTGNEPVNFLLLGSDERANEDGPGRSDTIMFFRMNPEKKIAYLVSFPRDSKVEIPGHGERKINAAYQLGGPQLMLETVQNLTGFDVNHCVIVDFKGFKDIIDAIGGIDIDVEKKIRDRFEGQDVNFDPGLQHMDGEQALKYVRVRHVDDDFGRIGRQQQFIQAVMKKMWTASSIVKLPWVAKIAANNMTTDDGLGISEMITYGQMLRAIGRENIHMVTVPGEPKMIGDAAYVVLDEQKVAWLLDRIANDKPLELTDEEKLNENIKVAVQNGSGLSGTAKKMAEKLATYNFKVGEVGNAASFDYYKTQIVAPIEKAELANVMQQQLGFGEVVLDETMHSEADVVIIVGRDFADSISTQ